MTLTNGARREDARVVVVDGVRWLVYEHAPPLDRRSAPSLVFESDEVMRRVRDFPADWRVMPDLALFDLSWKT